MGQQNDLYAIAKKVDINYNAFMIRDLRVNTWILLTLQVELEEMHI